MPIPTTWRRVPQPLTVGVIVLGAIVLMGCRESDNGFNPGGRGVEATVTGFPATLQVGENKQPTTPDFPPIIDEAATLAEADIRADFADRAWIDALVSVRADDATMVMVMDPEAADLSDEAILEACTALAGEAFSETGLDPVVLEARVEDVDGNELRSTDGPQCV